MARSVTTWDPFREVSSLREDMERLFDSMFGRLPRERVESFWSPALDIQETADSIVVHAELPGMKKEDIKVSLTGDTLTISGERKFESEQKGKTWYRVERNYGRFQRTVVLPSDVMGEKAKAVYKAGILELTLPKSEKAKAREITIAAEE